MWPHLDTKNIFSEHSLHRIEENLTLCSFSQAGAFGYPWTEEGGAYVQAATLAQTWFAAWFTGGVESLQRGGVSLHAASWLSARPAAHQWRPAHQNRGAVERRTGHDAEDRDSGWRWLGLEHRFMSVFAYTHVFFVLLCVFVCQDESQDENTCCLKDLQEGLVGKMLVRKSGKIQLILGNITLDVALGTSCAFLQVSYAHQCCVSPSGHRKCRWEWLFMGTDLEKCTIRSLVQSLCNEWVPSEWKSK